MTCKEWEARKLQIYLLHENEGYTWQRLARRFGHTRPGIQRMYQEVREKLKEEARQEKIRKIGREIGDELQKEKIKQDYFSPTYLRGNHYSSDLPAQRPARQVPNLIYDDLLEPVYYY
jgi:hypothetical protein